MVYISWSEFLENSFTKPLGPSVGVIQMWTKRNEHVARNGCADFFNIYPKRAILGQNEV
jgi:hypothetical protein